MQFQIVSNYSPHKRDWNFLGDGGFWKIKRYKEMYEALLEFPEGKGGVRKKIPSVGEAWIFSGTTHYYIKVSGIRSGNK